MLGRKRQGEGPISKAHLFIEHLLSIFCARGKDTEWRKVFLSSLPRLPQDSVGLSAGYGRKTTRAAAWSSKAWWGLEIEWGAEQRALAEVNALGFMDTCMWDVTERWT